MRDPTALVHNIKGVCMTDPTALVHKIYLQLWSLLNSDIYVLMQLGKFPLVQRSDPHSGPLRFH
jgi:hypothetical protein